MSPSHEAQPGHRLLHPGPSLPGHTVQRDEARNVWVIDGTLVPCTRSEFGCLGVLMEQVNHAVPFAHLAAALSGVDANSEWKTARRRLRQVISSLRDKMWTVGFEIISLRNVGYMLLPETPDDEPARKGHHVSASREAY